MNNAAKLAGRVEISAWADAGTSDAFVPSSFQSGQSGKSRCEAVRGLLDGLTFYRPEPRRGQT